MNCNCSALIFLRSFLNQRLAGARPMVPRKQLRLALLFHFQNVRNNFTIKTLQRAHNSSAKAFFCVKATSIFQGTLYIIQSKHYKELLIFGQGLLLCQSHMICINHIKSRYAQITLRHKSRYAHTLSPLLRRNPSVSPGVSAKVFIRRCHVKKQSATSVMLDSKSAGGLVLAFQKIFKVIDMDGRPSGIESL